MNERKEKTCPSCNGSGQVMNIIMWAVGVPVLFDTCGTCGGSGKVRDN